MEKSPLEDSIRKESQCLIVAIREKEAAEIKKQEEACTDEIERFRIKCEAETETKIAQGLARLENRSILERKKVNLHIIEDFINQIVEEAVKELRNDPRYKHFLLHTVCDAARRIQKKADVYLKKEDLVFENEIMEAVKAESRNHKIVIQEDNTIKWGGCIVNDELGGRRFNNTIERVYFRKSFVIRREAMRILKQKGLAL